MKFALRSQLFIIQALILSACTHPITKEARAPIDPAITFAMVSENPTAFLDRHLLVGGAVIALESAEEGSLLEIMEWRLNRWGEPAYLEDAGRRLLVRTSAELDPMTYEPGTLVTMTGVVLGHETRLLGEHKFDYPVFGLTEIHLWESPFRYGIRSNPDPSYPYYIDQCNGSRCNPYDSGYNPYPYTQYRYRNTGYQ
jgi:outer membrane lipoprotein